MEPAQLDRIHGDKQGRAYTSHAAASSKNVTIAGLSACRRRFWQRGEDLRRSVGT
jgi:hypothetical protein